MIQSKKKAVDIFSHIVTYAIATSRTPAMKYLLSMCPIIDDSDDEEKKIRPTFVREKKERIFLYLVHSFAFVANRMINCKRR